MSDYSPVRTSGVQPFTATTSGVVAGGTLVMVSGSGTVDTATALGAAKVVGVAAHDAASGARLTVWPLAGVDHLVPCPGGAAAGEGVVAGDAGIAVKAAHAGGPPTDFAAAAAAGTLLGIVAVMVVADAASLVHFTGRG